MAATSAYTSSSASENEIRATRSSGTGSATSSVAATSISSARSVSSSGSAAARATSGLTPAGKSSFVITVLPPIEDRVRAGP